MDKPERFGLLGRLVGHSFYYLNGAALKKITFDVYSRKLITFHMGDERYFVRSKGNKLQRTSQSDRLAATGADPFFAAAWFDVPLSSADLVSVYIYDLKLAKNGDLVGNLNGHPEVKQRWWAQIDQAAAKEIVAEQDRVRPDLLKEVAEVDRDIQRQCPQGLVGDDCRDLYKTRADIRDQAGLDEQDPELAAYDAKWVQNSIDRHQAAAAENNAMLGAMASMVSSNLAAAQAARLAQSQVRAATAASARSVRVQATPVIMAQSSSVPAPIGQIASAFGPLPAGIGTSSQRQFWQSRCQNQLNDNSPAAVGCRNTRQSYQRTPTATASATSATSVGGLVSSRPVPTTSATAQPVACVGVSPNGRATLHNSCGFTVTVAYCTTTPQAAAVWRCGGSGGGMDTIAAGADMSTAITLGNEDYHGDYHLRWVACRGGLGNGRPILGNNGRPSRCD